MEFAYEILGILFIPFIISACITNQNVQKEEAPECMNYHAMMTAPMPEQAIESLKKLVMNLENSFEHLYLKRIYYYENSKLKITTDRSYFCNLSSYFSSLF